MLGDVTCRGDNEEDAMKRRTRKPGTVSGLSGHHLGMTVRIDGTDYHLTFVSHRPRSVRVLAEWDDPDSDDTYFKGDRTFPRLDAVHGRGLGSLVPADVGREVQGAPGAGEAR
jgi:hypothetical protein